MINENYVESKPSIDNLIDIFGRDAWASKLPIEGINVGFSDNFDDFRVKSWNNLCPVGGKTILELGPLECGHTYMLEQFGAKSVTSIEASKICYLKCLMIKDIFGLKVNLLHGDFREYLQDCDKRYDVVMASGVLYHMTDPVKLIMDICKVTDNVFMWTNYYTDSDVASFNFEKEPVSLAGKYYGYKHYYHENNIKVNSFCGGTAPHAVWLRKEDIISVFQDAEFNDIVVIEDSILPSFGNRCMTLFARKQSVMASDEMVGVVNSVLNADMVSKQHMESVLEAQRIRYENSMSWKLTKPLRTLRKLIRG